jgi:hypothetical protein
MFDRVGILWETTTAPFHAHVVASQPPSQCRLFDEHSPTPLSFIVLEVIVTIVAVGTREIADDEVLL